MGCADLKALAAACTSLLARPNMVASSEEMTRSSHLPVGERDESKQLKHLFLAHKNPIVKGKHPRRIAIASELDCEVVWATACLLLTETAIFALDFVLEKRGNHGKYNYTRN
jgi:hypothetical protein